MGLRAPGLIALVLIVAALWSGYPDWCLSSGCRSVMFKKILIANRGEIACRVIRTARRMGIKTVAVYSDADARAPHVKMADESGAARAAAGGESYLKAELIIDACKATGAEAVHPGYGFLSRARELRQGAGQGRDRLHRPAAQGHRGDGRQDRIQEAGAEGRRQRRPRLSRRYRDHRRGGEDRRRHRLSGDDEGLGRRRRQGHAARVEREGRARGLRQREARGARRASATTACSSRSSSRQPRHIEIQVLGDQHGNIVYLNERECSIQRRHQKVVEEAPSPFVTPEMRKAMGEQAVALARAVGYYSRGDGRADRQRRRPDAARASTSSR